MNRLIPALLIAFAMAFAVRAVSHIHLPGQSASQFASPMHALSGASRMFASPNVSPAATPSGGHSAEYYGPGTNLERIDLMLLDQVRGNLDIAMYAFTDHELADKLLSLAERGVRIRIYRDNQQFQQERERSDYVAQTLARSPNISIRVKGSRTLMHLKAFADEATLREGSANWSPGGEKQQDNSIVVFRDRTSAPAFHRMFDEMWDRSDNIQVQ